MQSSSREMGGAILVIGGEIPVHIPVQQVVWRGKANLGWHAAANANFLFLPHPIFQIGHFVRRYLHICPSPPQPRLPRIPANPPPLTLSLTLLRALHTS